MQQRSLNQVFGAVAVVMMWACGSESPAPEAASGGAGAGATGGAGGSAAGTGGAAGTSGPDQPAGAAGRPPMPETDARAPEPRDGGGFPHSDAGMREAAVFVPSDGGVADQGLVGWATQHPNGAPTGGFAPIGGNQPVTCTATDMKTLRDCLYRSKKADKVNSDTRPGKPDWSTWEVHNGVTGGWKNYPLTIFIKGIINANVNDTGVVLGQADYEAGSDPLCMPQGDKQQPCQQDVTQVKVERGNVSVIGIPGDHGEPATLLSGWLLFNGQDNLIVRNVRFVGATDFWSKFEACSPGITDRDYCAWNAEPDGLTFVGCQRAWVDHCDFTDGAELEGAQTDKTLYKYYDGLLDIKSGSDYITISYSHFYNHNKAMLIGATDSDDGRYRVTFHHNWIKWVQQRMPRVRNGEVHVLNNLYEGPAKTAATQEYYFGYAMGIGFNSKIYSERNAFDVPGVMPTDLVSANFDSWGQYFTDVGSWLGGTPVDLGAAAAKVINDRNAGGATPFLGPVAWSPAASYPYQADMSADEVRANVLGSAGVGKVPPVPRPYMH